MFPFYKHITLHYLYFLFFIIFSSIIINYIIISYIIIIALTKKGTSNTLFWSLWTHIYGYLTSKMVKKLLLDICFYILIKWWSKKKERKTTNKFSLKVQTIQGIIRSGNTNLHKSTTASLYLKQQHEQYGGLYMLNSWWWSRRII